MDMHGALPCLPIILLASRITWTSARSAWRGTPAAPATPSTAAWPSLSGWRTARQPCLTSHTIVLITHEYNWSHRRQLSWEGRTVEIQISCEWSFAAREGEEWQGNWNRHVDSHLQIKPLKHYALIINTAWVSSFLLVPSFIKFRMKPFLSPFLSSICNLITVFENDRCYTWPASMSVWNFLAETPDVVNMEAPLPYL